MTIDSNIIKHKFNFIKMPILQEKTIVGGSPFEFHL